MARKKSDQNTENENKMNVKKTTRKKKTDAETAVDVAVQAEAPVPKKRGRKPKNVETAAGGAPAPKKRGRKPKNAETAAAEAPVPKKRGRKKAEPKMVAEAAPAVAAETAFADSEPMDLKPEMIVEIDKTAEAAAPVKKARKPRAKKAEQAAVPAEPKKRGRKKKEEELVLETILQIGETEFDITDIAQKAYKAYKSVHKRKVVTDFRIYVKPEESAAYFTINGEGSEDFKVDLK